MRALHEAQCMPVIFSLVVVIFFALRRHHVQYSRKHSHGTAEGIFPRRFRSKFNAGGRLLEILTHAEFGDLKNPATAAPAALNSYAHRNAHLDRKGVTWGIIRRGIREPHGNNLNISIQSDIRVGSCCAPADAAFAFESKRGSESGYPATVNPFWMFQRPSTMTSAPENWKEFPALPLSAPETMAKREESGCRAKRKTRKHYATDPETPRGESVYLKRLSEAAGRKSCGAQKEKAWPSAPFLGIQNAMRNCLRHARQRTSTTAARYQHLKTHDHHVQCREHGNDSGHER